MTTVGLSGDSHSTHSTHERVGPEGFKAVAKWRRKWLVRDAFLPPVREQTWGPKAAACPGLTARWRRRALRRWSRASDTRNIGPRGDPATKHTHEYNPRDSANGYGW